MTGPPEALPGLRPQRHRHQRRLLGGRPPDEMGVLRGSRMDKMHRAMLTVLLLGAATQLGGCLFDTREPEPPQTAAIDYLPRSSPGNVWENCRLALTNKDSGGWDTAISENFQYVPDGATESSFPGVAWASAGTRRPSSPSSAICFDRRDHPEPPSPNGSTRASTPPTVPAVWPSGTSSTSLTVTNSLGSTTRYRGRCRAPVHPGGQLLVPQLLARRAGRAGSRQRRQHPGDHGSAAGNVRP